MKKSILSLFSLIFVGGLAYVGSAQLYGQYLVSQLQQEPLKLEVPLLQQSMGTSCGEAVIAMAYNYAYSQTRIYEQDVIEYATAEGYYTEAISPYTSPANMVRIARYYAEDVATGSVINSGQGLSLLMRKLRNGEPVIIDVLSNFTAPESEAHFIVVTGISIDPDRKDTIVIHYNDPFTGEFESADWAGNQGVWNAWQKNGDPGGSGWWLVISPPQSP